MRSISVIFFLLFFLSAFSQGDDQALLYQKFDHIYESNGDEDKLQANSEFKAYFIAYIKDQPEVVMNDDFEQLRMFKGLSPNGSFRIFNWNVPLDGKNHYECLFLITVGNEVRIVECQNHPSNISLLKNKTADHKRWPSALYYDIIPFNKKKKNQFLLLGWDGNNELTNRKIIEVVTINKGNVKFGAPVFKNYPERVRRVIFEYADEAAMSLNHDKKNKRLIFDHLAPSSQNLEGQYQFYGPDMTFDSFTFKKGALYFEENISFERVRNSKDKQFNNPRR